MRKRLDRQPARHLYSGNLFRAALEHAERTADEAWILSALHHLLDLDEEIDPYNLSLKAYRKREREIWGHRVAVALSSKYGRLEVQLIAYAGREYIDPLRTALWFLRPPLKARIETPLGGLMLGERLAWFKRQRPGPPVPSHLCQVCRHVLLQPWERDYDRCEKCREHRRKVPPGEG